MPSGSEEYLVQPDDRVLAATRWLAVIVVPFLAVAIVILFLFPTRTGELFAWPIDPPLSAFMLASAYAGGLYYFTRVAVVRRWHAVRHGFPAIVVFTCALLAATLLHLDKFSQNPAFYTWLALYATTPVAVAVLAVVQAPRDPRSPGTGEFLVPSPVRAALAVIGACAFVAGAVLFFVPDVAVSLWAWQLTPLTGQVVGAVLSLTGVVNAALIWDARWSAFRILFQSQLLSLAAICVSLLVRGADLQWERPATPMFVALVVGAVLAYGGFTLWCERAERRRASTGR